MKSFNVSAVGVLMSGIALSAPTIAEVTNTVVLASDIEWGKLNPARGDKSPKAANLWGDRKADVATGFLVEFEDGFSSPPHIHNVTYRGVVISGTVHNDDPQAAHTWMPAGSFWTQVVGESHITAAKGKRNLTYIEIDSGPYLVRPLEQAFETSERSINIDQTNLVWLSAADTLWINSQSSKLPPAQLPHISFLWGNPENSEPNGTFLKLPAQTSGQLHSSGKIRAVLIQGKLNYAGSDAVLEPGSLFSADGASVHKISTTGQSDVVIYVRTEGQYQYKVD
ncbi:DUF4437 domain-containing protein [Echinimonas agarilytica]|uniref:DUF4437 domain-containing protein n=1 Tax=Echinimonas agarilytica TaxID=1215918 RepID=A0AA41W5Z7_9GAMM|nr:DUF4437 domain-containing protein [Echinimonas agarilytica]MCM2679714.1 DUF4437 domain-containing protein [Echinimonas agarilytica]